MWPHAGSWWNDWGNTIANWVEHFLYSTAHALRSVFDWQVEADTPAAAMAGDGSEPDGKPPPPAGGKSFHLQTGTSSCTGGFKAQ